MNQKLKQSLKRSVAFKFYRKAKTLLKSKENITEYSLSDFPSHGDGKLHFRIIKDLEGYEKFRAENSAEFEYRQKVENKLAEKQKTVYLNAYDPLTNKKAKFYIGYESHWLGENNLKVPNFRETALCPSNLFNSRLRATILSFEHLIPEDKRSKSSYYLTEKVTDLYSYFHKKYSNVTGSEYLGPEYQSGKIVNGIRHEDLTRLSFKNDSFDVLISLEVIEHIPDFTKALQEIYRVLRPEGAAIITAPISPGKYENTIRATISKTGEITHIMEPEYHGDPVNVAGGILCFQHFGWEIITQLKQAGFSDAGIIFTWSLENAILGSDIGVIYAIK